MTACGIIHGKMEHAAVSIFPDFFGWKKRGPVGCPDKISNPPKENLIIVMIQNSYFFRTVKIEGRPRLRPLPGQKDSMGNTIDEGLNVQADSIMRGSYPIGTVFGSESIELRTHSTTPFYSAGAIYPMGLNLGDYIVGSHIPPKEMTDAWNDFKAKSAEAPVEASLFSEPAPAQTEPATGGSLLSQLKSDKRYGVPTIAKDGFYIAPKDWWLLIRNIVGKVNTMLVGASGSGKTELVMLACRKLGLSCSVYDMGSMYDPVAGLLGVHRLQKGGESVFDYAKFTQDIQKPGVVLLDELSRAPVTTNNILFPCLDSRRTLPVEMAGGDGLRAIKVHPECVFIATANVGAEYTGTMSMDRALVGRFFPLELDYMPCTEEAKVLTKRCGIAATDAANIVAVAETVRSLFAKQELSCSVSTRETLMAGKLVSDGWTALEAMELTFLPLFEGTRTDGERSIVSKIFMTR